MSSIFKTINPSTGNLLNEYPLISNNELENKLQLSESSFEIWNKKSIKIRCNLLEKAAEALLINKEKYSNLITREMGKPCSQAVAEVEKCAWVCKYYAEKALDYLKDIEIKTEFSKSYVSYKALGTIFAIMPWNFPFWQVFRFAVPNLAAGNTVVLKHSPNTTGTAELIEKIFLEAGFAKGVFQNLIISNEQASKVIADHRIKGIAFTGSSRTGSLIAEQAGRELKKTVLELGGSDAYVILEDADVEKAAEICVTGRMLNSGQSCISAKRFIVDNRIKKEFTDRVIDKMKKYQIGDPLSCSVNFGPMARKDLQQIIDDQVKRSIEAGADLLLGGEIPDRKGFYYPATVLSKVKPGMPCFDEETFGPVASITSFDTEEQAIALANNSSFGLGAAVITGDISRGEMIAKDKLKSGSAFVNDFVKSDPRLPFGGIKQSGYGRELSLIGMHEFVNAKTICVK